MARKVKRYQAPRNAAERIQEAKSAIARIEHELNTVRDAKYGDYGRSCRDSIARWQLVIDRETKVAETMMAMSLPEPSS